MSNYSPQQLKDIKVVVKFVAVYCAARHKGQAGVDLPAELAGLSRDLRLCSECQALLDHALHKRRVCPLDPKPSCKHCHIHCYGKEYREKMRKIMAFSGRRMIMRGRLDYLWHYFF